MRTAELRSTVTTTSRRKKENGSDTSVASFSNSDVFLSILNGGGEALNMVIESEYHRLTASERANIFRLICDASFKQKGFADYRLLKARFNPENQYRVTVSSGGKEEVFDCFKYEGKFHTGKSLYINTSFIKQVTLLSQQARRSVN